MGALRSVTGQEASWVDAVSPDDEVLLQLQQQFALHPITVEELRHPSRRSRCDRFAEYIYLVLHLPLWQPEEKTTKTVEIDILLKPNVLATVRYSSFAPLDDFFQACLSDPNRRNQCFSGNAFSIFHALCGEIFAFLMRQESHIDRNIERLDRIIFDEERYELLSDLRYVKRDILNFRRIVSQNQKVFEDLLVQEDFFGKEFYPYLRGLEGEYLRVKETIDLFYDTIAALENSHHLFLNFQTTALVKRFTLLAFATFPLALVVGIVNVTSVENPLRAVPGAFWMVVVGVAAVFVGMIIFFRQKKWL